MTHGIRPRMCPNCSGLLDAGRHCPLCGYGHQSFGPAEKLQEKPPLRCYQDPAVTCNLKKLKMAPSNFCSQTETRCKRLKRKQKQTRRKKAKGTVPQTKPDKMTVLGEWFQRVRS